MGLAKFGKGDWRSISRNFVITRTPTQVESSCPFFGALWGLFSRPHELSAPRCSSDTPA